MVETKAKTPLLQTKTTEVPAKPALTIPQKQKGQQQPAQQPSIENMSQIILDRLNELESTHKPNANAGATDKGDPRNGDASQPLDPVAQMNNKVLEQQS